MSDRDTGRPDGGSSPSPSEWRVIMDLMPTMESAGIALSAGGVVLGIGAWLWPRTGPRRRRHERLRVTVSNHFPVFNRGDGSQRLGDLLVAVTVSNGTDRPVKATGWGVHLPGNRNLVAFAPTTTWEPTLPHWVQPGDEATWYLDAERVRSQAAELSCRFKDMRPYVSFAGGREVLADRGIPLE